jgi:DNA-binding NarL/FixJ family response regulator
LIKVLLAEDHNIVRNGIKSLLDNEPGIQVVAEATNGREALTRIEDGLEADLILADINMPDMTGLELVKSLKNASFSHVKVLLLSMLDHENYIMESINIGASGYLLKNVSKDEMLFAIKHVSAGNQYICSELAFKLLYKLSHTPELHHDPKVASTLSKREMEVLSLIAQGHTNTEIADMLFTSRRTVEGHRQNLIEKTGVKNTAALIRFAIKTGIIN